MAARKERILRLRLSNAMRRTSLEVLRESLITVGECEEAMARIRAAVSTNLLRLPARLCHELAHREPRHIQQLLDAALRSAFERLSRLGMYLDSNP